MSTIAVEDEPAAAFVDDRLGLDVVLVANLPDDLLEHVFDGHQAGRAAVFVHDDGDLRLLALKLLQQLRHALALRHDDRRPQQLGDRPGIIGLVERDEILDEDEAGDVVEALLEDRESASTPVRETARADRRWSRAPGCRRCRDEAS